MIWVTKPRLLSRWRLYLTVGSSWLRYGGSQGRVRAGGRIRNEQASWVFLAAVVTLRLLESRDLVQLHLLENSDVLHPHRIDLAHVFLLDVLGERIFVWTRVSQHRRSSLGRRRFLPVALCTFQCAFDFLIHVQEVLEVSMLLQSICRWPRCSCDGRGLSLIISSRIKCNQLVGGLHALLNLPVINTIDIKCCFQEAKLAGLES